MGYCRSPRHHIGIKLVGLASRQFENAARLLKKRIETVARVALTECFAIGPPRKWKHRVELEAKLQRDFRRHLVGSVGKRGDEHQLRRRGREMAAVPFHQANRARGKIDDDLPQPIPQLGVRRKRIEAVAGDAQAEDERNLGRPLRRARRLQPCPGLGNWPLRQESELKMFPPPFDMIGSQK